MWKFAVLSMFLGQYDAPPEPVPPLASFKPSGQTFRARVNAIKAHEKKHNPGGDPRITTSIFVITARNGTRSWLKRSRWKDGEVQFTVSRVTDIVDPVVALETAEAKATKTLEGCRSNTKRLLDWYLNDEGEAFALTGCLLEPPPVEE
ncbi:MAG: hypothetical protein AAF654_00650 [Myxococcota bacterium]